MKQRLDVALVERGLAETRSKAQSLIMARRVLVNGQYVDKEGAGVGGDDEVVLVALEHPWVGRGGWGGGGGRGRGGGGGGGGTGGWGWWRGGPPGGGGGG